MKKILVCLFLLGSQCFGLPLDWNPRTPLQYRTSAHWYLSNTGADDFETFAGAACTTAIRNFLARGGNFSSATVRQYSIKVKDLRPASDPNSGRDGRFYHWTNSRNLLQIARSRNYESIFSNMRTSRVRAQVSQNQFSLFQSGQNYLFVAADTFSSRDYGTILMSIQINPEDRVFLSYGDLPTAPISRSELVLRIQSEIIARDAALAACRASDTTMVDDGAQPILISLAAEASGMSLIAYYGLDNAANGESQFFQWMEVVGPWAIQNMSFVEEK